MLFSAIGLFGIYFGVRMVLSVDPSVFKPLVGAIILLLVVYTYRHKGLGLAAEPAVPTKSSLLLYPIAFFMGFYESFLGSGNGILFTIMTSRSRGYQLQTALGYYFAAAFVWVSLATVLYLSHGIVDPPIMASAISGSVLGAYTGARWARKKGNPFSRKVFLVAGLVLGLKMLFDL
ncbi:MAG TPA: sulfite exporter TauE/SafE family protein [Sediminispirochaeta sp.]|nr:sulfite exporter TauE/SafE family protein [Sediminispirochaeta sp.]